MPQSNAVVKSDTAPELPSAPRESLKQAYDRYFRVVMAETGDQLEESFRLRYQVYCVENDYEPVADNPGQRETDELDAQSRHSLLLQQSTGLTIGTTRLILPRRQAGDVPLPIERLCSEVLLNQYADRIPADRTAEMSRFAIAKEFRRRAEDKESIAGGLFNTAAPDSRRVIPHISLGLMQAIVAMARESDMTHLYAVMEPALLRMLRHLGIHFENIGPVVIYHGRRQPCFCDLDALLTTAWTERPDVWEVLTDCGRIWPLSQAGRAGAADTQG
jgi:N-acyl amino acid synthase of PEP-CTERM/exosortase system